MFKISYIMSSNILSDIFDQRTSSYHLLKNNDFASRQIHCIYQGTEWLSFLVPNFWDLEPLEIKQSERNVSTCRKTKWIVTLPLNILAHYFELIFRIHYCRIHLKWEIFKITFYCYYQLHYFLSILIASLSFYFIICIIIYSKISFS